MREKVQSLTGVLEMLIIFGLVMGGLFKGFFTPTEAGAIGAFCTLLIAIIRRQITWNGFAQSLVETTRISWMVLVIVTGATVFGHFLAITRIPFDLAGWAKDLPLPPWGIMSVILFIYLVGGCFIDALALILLTIPIFFPVAVNIGYDPIWFGVIIVMVTQVGVITPPVGVNVYVVSGVAKDVPLEVIFKGIVPLLLALIAAVILMVIFSQIALFLPSFMR